MTNGSNASSAILYSHCLHKSHPYILGRTIPVAFDRHLEHPLNRLCKDAITGLGANKTETANTRVGKCIGPLSKVLATIDAINSLSKPSGLDLLNPHRKGTTIRFWRSQLRELKFLTLLQDVAIHSYLIQDNMNILRKVKKEELESWIKDHIKCNAK